MAGRIQYRIQLAFRATDTAHMAAYNFLKNLEDKTDVIVALLQRSVIAPNGVSAAATEPEPVVAPVPAAAPVIDYQELTKALRPLIDEAVQSAVLRMNSIQLQDYEKKTVSDTLSSSETEPPPKDLSLALEGMEMFYQGKKPFGD